MDTDIKCHFPWLAKNWLAHVCMDVIYVYWLIGNGIQEQVQDLDNVKKGNIFENFQAF